MAKEQGITVKKKDNKELFGAYLAGVIDGDGYVRIKKNYGDRRIPQCVIRIASYHPLNELAQLIKFHMGCQVHFEHANKGKSVNTCFYLSGKNLKFFSKFIAKHLQIVHKKTAFRDFVIIKASP